MPVVLPEPALPPPLFSPATPVLWTGTWFVCFCFLANQRQRSPPKEFLLGNSSTKAAITFAFFSIFIWVRMSLLSPAPSAEQGQEG